MRRSSNSSLSIRRSGSWHMTSRRSRETAAGVLPASGMPQAAETAEAPAGASAPKAAVRLAGTGVPGGRNRPAGCDYAERIVVHRNGNLLAVQFQPGCNRFYLLKFSVGKSEEQQFFHRYLQKSDRSFVRGHYNTDLQEYNEKQCEKMSGFPVICDCGYGADMVV